eukprot:scaffold1372_cov351-Pavlova_lutheri.AAC.14
MAFPRPTTRVWTAHVHAWRGRRYKGTQARFKGMDGRASDPPRPAEGTDSDVHRGTRPPPARRPVRRVERTGARHVPRLAPRTWSPRRSTPPAREKASIPVVRPCASPAPPTAPPPSLPAARVLPDLHQDAFLLSRPPSSPPSSSVGLLLHEDPVPANSNDVLNAFRVGIGPPPPTRPRAQGSTLHPTEEGVSSPISDTWGRRRWHGGFRRRVASVDGFRKRAREGREGLEAGRRRPFVRQGERKHKPTGGTSRRDATLRIRDKDRRETYKANPST